MEPELRRLAGAFTGPDLQRRQAEAWRAATTRLADQALIRQAAREAGLTVSEDEVKSYVHQHMTRLRMPDERHFAEMLEAEGQTLDDLREGYRARLLVQRYLDQVLKPSPPPPPGEVLRYYADHVAEFAAPQEVQLRQIILPKSKFHSRAEAEAKLRELWTAIESGADFGELAKRHSDSAYAQDGGLFPYQPVSSLRSDLQDLVRAVSTGKTTAVQETAESFLIVRVDGIRQGSPHPSDEAQGEILERMRQADLDRRREHMLQLLRQRSFLWTARDEAPAAP